LTSITIPDGVTSISNSAFNGCSGLKSITIPKSITYIGSSAFEGCSGLNDVYCWADKISDGYQNDVGLTTANSAFSGSYLKNVTLHVPEGSVEAYQSVKPWNKFGKIIPLEVASVLGDVNGDGVLNAADIVCVVNIIKKGASMDDITIADLNGDGEVNSADVDEIAKKIMTIEQ
jgi:hypothetical protein